MARYSDDFKAAVLARLAAGEGVMNVARDTGVSDTTLIVWKKTAKVLTLEERVAELEARVARLEKRRR